jgi:hypothetical protein
MLEVNDYLDRRAREDSDLIYGSENRKDFLDPGSRGKVVGVLLISCARCEGHKKLTRFSTTTG